MKEKNTTHIRKEIAELKLEKARIEYEIKQLNSRKKKAEILYHIHMFNTFNPGASKIWN